MSALWAGFGEMQALSSLGTTLLVVAAFLVSLSGWLCSFLKISSSVPYSWKPQIPGVATTFLASLSQFYALPSQGHTV